MWWPPVIRQKIVRLLHERAECRPGQWRQPLSAQQGRRREPGAHLGKPGIAVTSFRPRSSSGRMTVSSTASPSCCEYGPAAGVPDARLSPVYIGDVAFPHSPMHWKTGPPSASTMSCADPGPTPWSNWCALSPGTAANAKSSCACRTGHRACRPRSCNMPRQTVHADNYLSLRTPSVCRKTAWPRSGNCHLTGKRRHTFSDPHGQESAT